MKLGDYDYTLPEELIVQEPAAVRDHSRLMVLDAGHDAIRHAIFTEIASYLHPGDVLVVNDTKVFPARLIGRKAETGAEIEIFLLNRHSETTWDALSRPSRRVGIGTGLIFGNGLLTGIITEKGDEGRVQIAFDADVPIDEAIDQIGNIPLPPYIKRPPGPEDRDRYQTVYAEHRGAVAAPTAGFHFTRELLNELAGKGVRKATVTLHVGIGTFRPLKEEDFARKNLHREYCTITEQTVDTIRKCREAGGRIFSVGTTTARALESASRNGALEPFEGWTDLFIKEPYQFRSIDALITNFHLPCSSLLIMVCAFAGRERMLEAYREAVRERYRFYSYGDAMLIMGNKS